MIWIVAAFLFIKGNVQVGNSRTFFSLALPGLLAFISLSWSNDMLATVKMCFYCLTALLGYLVALNIFRVLNHKYIEHAVKTFSFLSVSVALMYWLKIPLFGSSFFRNLGFIGEDSEWSLAVEYSRLNNPFLGRSNDFGSILALYFFLFIGIALAKRRRVYYFWVFICLAGIILTFSRGVIITLVIILLLGVVNRLKARDYIVAILGVCVLGFIVIGFTSKAKAIGLDILSLRMGNWADISDRTSLWKEATHIISTNSLLGMGGGRYLSREATVFHNTYLEQWSSYGLFFGTIVNFVMLYLPMIFIFWRSKIRSVRTTAKFIGLAVLTFNVFCLVETSYEAAIPKLYLYIFVGISIAYLNAIQMDERNRFRENERHALPKLQGS